MHLLIPLLWAGGGATLLAGVGIWGAGRGVSLAGDGVLKAGAGAAIGLLAWGFATGKVKL